MKNLMHAHIVAIPALQPEEDDADTWLRVPETADPVLLVRQQ